MQWIGTSPCPCPNSNYVLPIDESCIQINCCSVLVSEEVRCCSKFAAAHYESFAIRLFKLAFFLLGLGILLLFYFLNERQNFNAELLPSLKKNTWHFYKKTSFSAMTPCNCFCVFCCDTTNFYFTSASTKCNLWYNSDGICFCAKNILFLPALGGKVESCVQPEV